MKFQQSISNPRTIPSQIYDGQSEKNSWTFIAPDRQQAHHQRAKNSSAASRCSKTACSRNTPSSATAAATSSAAFSKASQEHRDGLKAMFVDIGFEKNAFLHFWDAIPAALDSGIEEIDRPERPAAEKAHHGEGHPEHLSRRQRSDCAGDQGPDRNKGPAHHHEPQLRRPLSRAHALQRSQRHLAQDRGSEGARAAAQDSATSSTFPKALASSFAPLAKDSGRVISCAI